MSPTRFDHCLLYGDDVDGTVELFTEVLGFNIAERVVAGPEQFLIGAFLSCSNKPHDIAFIRQPVKGKFHHVSFNVADEHALEALRKRLDGFGCEVTTIVDHGFIHSVYFSDPNGIALEASWWVRDVTGRAANYDDDQLFGDPNPVPALDELRTTGTLASLPSTQLT